ncbi:hypothetical protein BGZ80_001394 [Entomortierella chlamydospora]|uniref:Uncharacterized protein n=1 Tax=Entomortierella chlamydospora TaxID=101097 RepID=A0A9P6MRN6_9FUNG|nr:hypothetical protein BGZ80_001394 [Entomortierella chlamydospora]
MEAVPNDSLSRFESYDSLSSITQSARMNVPQSQSPFTPQSQAQRPPSTCSSNNTNQSTPNEKRSRWSFTGRLFEKCKSISASSNIPNTEPQMAATSNGRNTEKIVSFSNTSGSRRSSLVDIPKALLSSFCRTSLTCSSEPKDKPSKSFQRRNLSDASINNDESTDQSSDVDGSAAGDEVEVVPTTTVITANDPCHVPPIPPKVFSSNDDDQLHVQPVKGILKRIDSSQETSNSITDDSSIPTTRVEGVSPSSYLLVSDNDRPLPENLDINSFSPSDHHAQSSTYSSIPYPHSHQQLHQQHQQQEQRRLLDPFIVESTPQVTKLAETVPFKPLELDSEPRTTQGADMPPEFTPGIQSNTYRDRGGERPQGMVIDPHGGDCIHANFAQIHRQRHPHHYHDPFAMSGGFSYPSKTVDDISDEKQYLDLSEADLASYQRSSISSQGIDDSVFEPSEAAVMEARRHRRTKEDVAMPMIRELDSHNEFNHNFHNGPRSSMDSSSDGGGGKKKSIRFNDTVEIIPVHRKSEYNRRSDRNATFRVLTPDLRAFIRDELNDYKMREMAVHVRSMGNTAFH